MDLRAPVLGIVCGGTPAPGLNGVISAATLQALNLNCRVLGFIEGFKHCKKGKAMIKDLRREDVTTIYNTAGAILKTSKEQLRSKQDVENTVRVLEHLRVRYLLIIGGVETATSVSLVAKAASEQKLTLSICHVPKTVFNDLPLPDDLATFGFGTARHVGYEIVKNFQTDSRDTSAWYVLVVIGAKSGHLTLGIGKAAAATLTVIPEEYHEKKNKLSLVVLCDLIECAIYKRKAMDREYGVAVLCEGLVDMMDPEEVKSRWGDIDTGRQELGRSVVAEIKKRFKEKEIPLKILNRNIGNELRSAAPITEDVLMTRDLGFGAVDYLVQENKSGDTLAIRGGSLITIPISKLVAHGSALVRTVDLAGMPYRVAQSYMIKVKLQDLEDLATLAKLARKSKLTADEFRERFGEIAKHNSELLKVSDSIVKSVGSIALVDSPK